ncbi:uncharacterized protein [Dysidea avara]|uniref:uncharacterized protein n=1 Tax=Dysidea avara TaxID=196820 RepID=UPI003320DF43
MHWWFHQLQDDIISWNPTYKVSLDLPLQAPQLQKSSGAQELAGIARSPMLSKQQEDMELIARLEVENTELKAENTELKKELTQCQQAIKTAIENGYLPNEQIVFYSIEESHYHHLQRPPNGDIAESDVSSAENENRASRNGVEDLQASNGESDEALHPTQDTHGHDHYLHLLK